MKNLSWRRFATACLTCGLVVTAAGAVPTVTIAEPDNNAVRGTTEKFDIRVAMDTDPAIGGIADKPEGTAWIGVYQGTATLFSKRYRPKASEGFIGEVTAEAQYKDSDGNPMDWPEGAATVKARVTNVVVSDTDSVVWPAEAVHNITFVVAGGPA